MLQLGLARITKLLAGTTQPWKAIHVAGTNGKGSVCAYITSMIRSSSLSERKRLLCGQFTSPHFIDRWDGIQVDGKQIADRKFLDIERRVQLKNKSESIEATPFEILTATAFEAFSQAHIDIGVIEVGVGGRLDATNALQNPLISVITKIGKDHENLLGNTVEEIAYQKAGIMKPGVPCFIDGTNLPGVRKVLKEYGASINSGPITFVELHNSLGRNNQSSNNVDPREMNKLLAAEAARYALAQHHMSLTFPPTTNHEPALPGRLQFENLSKLAPRSQKVLIDGAHNPQAAAALGQYVNQKLRRPSQPVTWLLAVTEGKNLNEMIPLMIAHGDNVVTVAFGPVDGMPWVQSMKADILLGRINHLVDINHSDCSTSIGSAIHQAVKIADQSPLVIAGSLYLVSDVLRLLRDANQASSQE